MTVVGGDLPSAGESSDRPTSGASGKSDEGVSDEAPEAGAPDAGDPERWRLVVVAHVSMDLPSAYPEVVLRESVTPYRELRIPVGLAEGTAIAYAWRGLQTPRPLTHELIIGIMTRHNVTIEAARITRRRGQAFYAELDMMGPSGRHVASCRPSDAIALALRAPLPTPVLVAEEVLTSGGAPASGAPASGAPASGGALTREGASES